MKTLLSLKADYKTATGKEWKPGQHVANSPSKPAASAPSGGGNADEINEKIVAQGNTVRDLKTSKAPKVNIFNLKQLMFSVFILTVLKKNRLLDCDYCLHCPKTID